jgi:hypothetical protein
LSVSNARNDDLNARELGKIRRVVVVHADELIDAGSAPYARPLAHWPGLTSRTREEIQRIERGLRVANGLYVASS